MPPMTQQKLDQADRGPGIAAMFSLGCAVAGDGGIDAAFGFQPTALQKLEANLRRPASARRQDARAQLIAGGRRLCEQSIDGGDFIGHLGRRRHAVGLPLGIPLASPIRIANFVILNCDLIYWTAVLAQHGGFSQQY
jgi:hypothetical protein